LWNWRDCSDRRRRRGEANLNSNLGHRKQNKYCDRFRSSTMFEIHRMFPSVVDQNQFRLVLASLLLLKPLVN